jgi:hypothetical protein
MGLISFSNIYVNTYASLVYSAGQSTLTNAINLLSPSGATNYNQTIRDAVNQLNSQQRAGILKAIVFVSDGAPTVCTSGGSGSSETPADVACSEAAAKYAADNNVSIFTIGIGSADFPLLKSMAFMTKGTFAYANDSTTLDAIYNSLAGGLCILNPSGSSNIVSGDAAAISGNSNVVVNVSVGGVTQFNTAFSGTQTVNVTSNGKPVMSFPVDFSAGGIDLTGVGVTTQRAGASAGSIIISGLTLQSGVTKTVYMDKLAGTNRVCIIDAAIASDTELTRGSCNSPNIYFSSCDSTGQTVIVGSHTYTCQDLGTQYKITGLSHSGSFEVEMSLGGVPEFSTLTTIMALGIVLSGFLFIRNRRN